MTEHLGVRASSSSGDDLLMCLSKTLPGLSKRSPPFGVRTAGAACSSLQVSVSPTCEIFCHVVPTERLWLNCDFGLLKCIGDSDAENGETYIVYFSSQR